ncbi:MAG: DUF2027 domain-containing protein [Prevotella sp.]|jgi:hypothetical protein|nr:DUF2027 domain-containing protein [Prevotella sp.]
MKIGDKVRFLSETGGGKVAGFQGNGIVLIEDEDGFQIPTPVNDVVVVSTDDYSMSKMISEKMDAKEKAEAHARTELKDDQRSIKTLLNAETAGQTEEEEPEDDPADKEITFKRPAEERKGGDRLSVYLAFVPKDVQALPDTEFETYIINDSNYTLQYTYLHAEGNAWILKQQSEVEPNTKLFVEKNTVMEIGQLGHIALQVMAYKKDKPFLWKTPVEAQFHIDAVKFCKQNSFAENDFFDQQALLYPIIENDVVSHPLHLDSRKLKDELYHTESSTKISGTPQLNKSEKEKDNLLVIDLHASSLLETTAGMQAVDILRYQLDYFKKIMDENLNRKGLKIVFIHGKGEGVLRHALIHELNYRYKHCTYQDASFQEYGYGATQITIH